MYKFILFFSPFVSAIVYDYHIACEVHYHKDDQRQFYMHLYWY